MTLPYTCILSSFDTLAVKSCTLYFSKGYRRDEASEMVRRDQSPLSPRFSQLGRLNGQANLKARVPRRGRDADITMMSTNYNTIGCV